MRIDVSVESLPEKKQLAVQESSAEDQERIAEKGEVHPSNPWIIPSSLKFSNLPISHTCTCLDGLGSSHLSFTQSLELISKITIGCVDSEVPNPYTDLIGFCIYIRYYLLEGSINLPEYARCFNFQLPYEDPEVCMASKRFALQEWAEQERMAEQEERIAEKGEVHQSNPWIISSLKFSNLQISHTCTCLDGLGRRHLSFRQSLELISIITTGYNTSLCVPHPRHNWGAFCNYIKHCQLEDSINLTEYSRHFNIQIPPSYNYAAKDVVKDVAKNGKSTKKNYNCSIM